MNIRSILGRYLTKQLLLNFLFVLGVVVSIVLLFEVIELLRKASNRGEVGLGFIMQLALTKLPKTIEMVFPFVMMISAMVTFWGLSKSNEFVTIRAAGVSIWGFLAPILLATFMVGVVNVVVINPISSQMNELYELLEYRFKTRNPDAVLFSKKGLWMRDTVSDGRVVIIQAKSARQEEDALFLRNVTLLEMDSKSNPLRRVEAYVANLDGKSLDLKDVKVYEAGKPTKVLNSLSTTTNLTLDRIKESFIEPNSISFWALSDVIDFYKKSGFSVHKHRLRYFSLLISPFLLCAMVLIAAVFALRPNNRKGGVMFLVVGGIVTGFGVYFLTQVIYAFGVNGQIPVFLAVVTPTLVAGLVSVSMLLHLEDG